MKKLIVLSQEDGRLIDALTTDRGVNGEPFLVVKQEKMHKGPNGLQVIRWRVSFRLTEEPNGAVRLTRTTTEFPSDSIAQIQQFYARKVRPTIEKLARRIGVSVQINLNYQRRSTNDVGIVAPK